MLVAFRRNGEEVSLLHSYPKAIWEQMRAEETFYCPVCKGKVQLKLGTIKQWHFAHVNLNHCIGSSEAESPLHLNGKRQLYSWLVKQDVQVALEPYIPSIQQRPDILFKSDNQVYALEFQCSSIPSERLQERTNGYLAKNILPLWVVGKPQLPRKQGLQQLKAYEWSMLQAYENCPQLFLIYYFPSKQTFLFLENILSLSAKKILFSPRKSSLQSTRYQDLFHRTSQKEANLSSEQWLTTRKYWRYANSPYPSYTERQFFKICYENHLYPSLFPIEAGWPTSHFQWIETPAHIWQTWVLLKLIKNNNGNAFSFESIYKEFKKALKKRQFTVRYFPQVNGHFSFALMSYLQFLVDVRVLNQVGKATFQVREPIVIPANIERAHELDRDFFLKYLQRLSYFRSLFI